MGNIIIAQTPDRRTARGEQRSRDARAEAQMLEGCPKHAAMAERPAPVYGKLV